MLRPNSRVTTVLINARDLILDPADWSRGAPLGPKGQRCALQALQTAMGGAMVAGTPEVRLLTTAGHRLFNGWPIWRINDHLGHAAVIRMYDLAIEGSLKMVPAGQETLQC